MSEASILSLLNRMETDALAAQESAEEAKRQAATAAVAKETQALCSGLIGIRDAYNLRLVNDPAVTTPLVASSRTLTKMGEEWVAVNVTTRYEGGDPRYVSGHDLTNIAHNTILFIDPTGAVASVVVSEGCDFHGHSVGKISDKVILSPREIYTSDDFRGGIKSRLRSKANTCLAAISPKMAQVETALRDASIPEAVREDYIEIRRRLRQALLDIPKFIENTIPKSPTQR